MKSFLIELPNVHYPFVVGSACIRELPSYLKTDTSKVMIVSDTRVASLHLSSVTAILDKTSIPYCECILPSGEVAKSLPYAEQMLTHAIRYGLDRASVMIALGGGAVGDVTGFVASIFMRGIDYIQVPTTVLAHDSSIGGKVAINHRLGKNLIGSFHHPLAVIFDTRFLMTLPDREYNSGFAEMIKHAVICDASFFHWLEENVDLLRSRHLPTLEYALFWSSKIKANIVKVDEHEANIRALLNFGHTVGHALESMYEYQLLHGEAVSIGMVVAATIAKSFLNYDIDVQKLITLCKSFHLPTAVPKKIDLQALADVILRDKKVKAGKLRMVFPTAIGSSVINADIPLEWIDNVMQQLTEDN